MASSAIYQWYNPQFMVVTTPIVPKWDDHPSKRYPPHLTAATCLAFNKIYRKWQRRVSSLCALVLAMFFLEGTLETPEGNSKRTQTPHSKLLRIWSLMSIMNIVVGLEQTWTVHATLL